MATITLDSIREAAEAKYGNTDIETSNGIVSLVNPLRLDKKDRERLLKLQDELSADDADQEKLLTEAIRLVAKTKASADHLLKEVKGDLTVLVEIFTAYGSESQVGEASASDD